MEINYKRWLLTSWIGSMALKPYRVTLLPWSVLVQKCKLAVRWLWLDREIGNFSYRLTSLSKRELAALINVCADLGPGVAEAYLRDFDAGVRSAVESAIARRTQASSFRWSQNDHVEVEQRLIYYMLVRALKPRIVFQSGTARGVGACLIAAALMQNESGGVAGRLITTDIDSNQGYGLENPWLEVVRFIPRNSVDVLRSMTESIDLYIHDTAPGVIARREFEAALPRLSRNACILSTWHSEDAMELARRLGRNYIVWRDKPDGHWFQSAGMALIIPEKSGSGRTS